MSWEDGEFEYQDAIKTQDILDMVTEMSLNSVVIIGAGVIGLQTAVTLLKAGYDVSVVAQYLPGDEHEHYTSLWAGAIWRTHAPRSDREACDWDRQTYLAWRQLLSDEKESGKVGESGLNMVPAIQYWDTLTDDIRDGARSVWWGSVVDNFQVVPVKDLPPGPVFGVSYDTFAINVPKYLSHLVGRVKTLGGRLMRATLPMDKGLAESLSAARKAARVTRPLAYVNATGLAAKWLAQDEAVDSIAGQTVLVRGEAKRHVARLGKKPTEVNVVIPHRGTGTSIVGASRHPGSWRTEIREDVTRDLLEKGKALAPELLDESGEFSVITPRIGLRPSRKGGARVELEKLPGGQVVIHEYGHAGAGYQNSIGSANKVLKLLSQHKDAERAEKSRL